MTDVVGAPSSVSTPKKSKGMPKSAVLILLVIVLVALFAWAEKNRRMTAKELETTSAQLEELRQSTGDSSEETANTVRGNVAKLMNLPTEPQPTVATITDVERLREANEFFKAADNGDFLILTGNRAILYDLDRNIILDVAPFRITQTSASPSPTGAARATATPTAQP